MFLNIKENKIHYEIQGEGVPLLMIHGFGLDHQSMKGAFEPLLDSEKFKAIYIDLPGMGLSESNDQIKNADDLLEVIQAVIKETIGEASFLVSGLSYGGYLARGLVKKMPERVLGVLLFCPVIYPKFNQRKLPEHEVLIKEDAFFATLSEDAALEFSQMNVVLTKTVYERQQKEMESGYKLCNPEFLERFQKEGYSFTFDVDKIDQPFDRSSLILVGKQDSCVGYEDAFMLNKNYTRLSYVALDTAGHGLHIEQEKLFNAHVLSWLDQMLRSVS